MSDLSNAEISVEGEYGYCLVCGELFHWTHLINLEAGDYCEEHVPEEPLAVTVIGVTLPPLTITSDVTFPYVQRIKPVKIAGTDDEGDMGHDTALERDMFGDAL